jgi:hypothetical protein
MMRTASTAWPRAPARYSDSALSPELAQAKKWIPNSITAAAGDAMPQ